MTIRPLKSMDLPDVYALDQKDSDVHWSLAQWERELSLPQAHFFVGHEKGLIAFAGYWAVAQEAQMMNIVVDSAYRRRGLGRQMLGHVLRDAGERACKRCTLEVGHTNIAAQQLYTAVGFQSTGRRAQFYPNADALLMEKSL